MQVKFLATLIAMCFTFISCAAKDNRGYIVEVGDKAPNIELVSPDGTKMMLADLKGKVVMLQFTATWCPVCIKEMPHIESDIWNKLKDNKEFALYGVMYKQGAKDAEQIKKMASTTYPLLLDTDGTRFHQFAMKGAGVTRNVIIDQEGNIAYLTRLFNEEEFGGMVKKINELL